jgi:hypothetical protein
MIRWYIEASLLLVVGYALVRAAFALWPRESVRLLTVSHLVLALAFLLPAAASVLPRQFLPRASVQVWAGKPRGHARPYTLIAPAAQALPRLRGISIEDERLGLFERLAAAALFAALLAYAWRVAGLVRALRGCTEVRRLGRVSILISDFSPAPFSAWLPGRAFVVLPLEFLARRDDYAIAVKHELQHHRQGDTRWAHFSEVCKALFFWNPAAFAWSRMAERMQELACDEILIGRRNISPQAYGDCLYRAAQRTLGASSASLAGTTGMAAGRSGLFLRRRIEMLFVADRKKSSKFASFVFVTGTLALMAGSAYAARGAVQDRTLGLGEVRNLVARNPGSEIPITVNERVLKRLDRYVGTPEGREYVKRCLSRLPFYKPMIEGKISAVGFPRLLLAVPMEESCFDNAHIPSNPYGSRGIWGFIEPTAINYGLRVDAHTDERVDPEKETAAAMSYFKDLYAQFGDWRLAIKGYNEGEKRVQVLIDQYHTRDPWKLEDIGTAEDYLAGTMAMMIILDHPTLLD